MYGHLEVCELLLENVVDKNPKDNNGNTPLHLAAQNGQFALCELILKNADEKNPKSNYGKTPLDSANPREKNEMKKLFENTH